MINPTNVIVAICSLLFIMIGVDKFVGFMEPPCSLESNISPIIWSTLGILQLIAGTLIWLPKYRKYVAGFFFVFMIIFTIVHLASDTYDVGGAVFMAVLLGLLTWNPRFLNRKENVINT